MINKHAITARLNTASLARAYLARDDRAHHAEAAVTAPTVER